MNRLLLSLSLLLLITMPLLAQDLVKVLASKDLDLVTEQADWIAGGGPESSVKMVTEPVKTGKRALQFSATIDLQGPAGSKYPAGWPSCQWVPPAPMDFRGYNRISFWIRVDSADRQRLFPIRFILHTDGKTTMNRLVRPFRAGEWVQASFDLTKLPDPDKVDTMHLFLCEDEYPDKLQMTFTVDGFELQKTESLGTYLPPEECTAALYTGEGEQWTLVEPAMATLPARLELTTGTKCPVQADDVVSWRVAGLFSGTVAEDRQPCGQSIAAGAKGEVALQIPLAKLQPDYYMLTADLRRGDKVLCAGRVGFDDFYVKKPGESMAYTALCNRLASAYFLEDRLYGGLLTHGSIALPHTYDPLNKDTYLFWLTRWCTDSGKNTEGLEAGVTGLVFACEALLKAGDTERLAFCEGLLKRTMDYMITGMQDPDGGVRIVTNELTRDHGDVLGEMGWVSSSRDSNQVGEWVRPIARGILYFRNRPGQQQYVQKLAKASFAAADFIVRNATDRVGEREHVLRHYGYPPYAEGVPVKRNLYHQEGRQCEVYTGRAMAGVSFVAYALATCGQEVPPSWLTMLRETTAWATERMQPKGGWFDWGCEDVVEGGCHTFLGNQYIGEGTMGHYLVEKVLNNKPQMDAAAEATKLAYHYVTDSCTIRGQRFGIPTEFWVGPYLYWELLEYNTYVDKDPKFAEWLQGITDRYTDKPGWVGFSDRGKDVMGRGTDNGSLVTSILAWLGLHYMDELGKPWQGYETMGK